MSICDCTNHMWEDGKNDATYIVEMFQEKVNVYDPDGRNTDVLFFNGASNMQKAGQILCQTFPRAYCFHGRKHGLSLFFSYLSKLKPNTRISHLSMTMDKSLLSIKETVSLDVEEMVVGSSLEFELKKMLKISYFVHSLQSP